MEHYQWAVIGAGPAGIAAVGKLIDHGIDQDSIVWIDPNFHVGDFGTMWSTVPSNTKVQLFKQFLENCAAFEFGQASKKFELLSLEPQETCHLGVMAEPLQWVTEKLLTKVVSHKTLVNKLEKVNGSWLLHSENKKVTANNVILAIGAEAKKMAMLGAEEISLKIAMNPQLLAKEIKSHDKVAVFGSSHSAVLALRNLIEATNVERIFNFYRSPLRYAVQLSDYILYDNTGLKGTTADWARLYLDANASDKITRILSTEENITRYFPRCNKVIYAVGFERRNQPIIPEFGHYQCCEKTGIIARGLFGLGIAFPELKIFPNGLAEQNVGLWKFIDYLNRVLPIWLNY